MRDSTKPKSLGSKTTVIAYLSRVIEENRCARGLTKSELCLHADVEKRGLQLLEDGSDEVLIYDVIRLAHFLEIDLKELFDNK